MDVALLLLALIGHTLVWVGLVNRIHSRFLPRWIIDALTLLCGVALLLIPVGLAFWYVSAGLAPAGWFDPLAPNWLVASYLLVCWAVTALGAGRWLRRWPLHRPPAILRWHRARSLGRLAPVSDPQAAGRVHHLLATLPGNEILQLDVVERALEVPRLVPALEGLTLVHASDFHFTGRVGKPYFHEVVELCNQLEPDLVAITGDLVDRGECIDWVPDTLGRLAARDGVYFVLGNHDLRVDTDRLRRTLVDAGLVDLGGRWIEVPIGGASVVLAGNQLPWIPPAADMQTAPRRRANGGPLRILLAHSPDQFDWAQAGDFDLMLAGHTHGGQIRLPLVGPIMIPSWTGARFASGVFYAAPTVLHVTRGVSGEVPLRLNCAPEIARLVLHGPHEAGHSSPAA
jgi:predicted MPP superfamily phosphohydrolase